MKNKSLMNETTFENIYSIYLMLGPSCNMSCRHCSQIPVKDINFSDALDDVTKSFFDSYISFVINKPAIKDKAYRCTIIPWGGEALLHWNFIKNFITYYTEKFNILKNNNLRFKITSNGLLLTDEIIDFCNKYQVVFALSYDAPNTFAVRGFVPDIVVDRFNRIDNRVVITGFNAYNTDVYASFRCLKEKFPGAIFYSQLDFVLTSEISEDIYRYDFNRMRRDFKKWRIAIQLGLFPELSILAYRKLSYLQNPALNYYFHKNNIKQCFCGLYTLNVSLDGKLWLCHNSSECIGTVKDSLDDIYHRAFILYKQNESLACLSCEHRDICVGPCNLSLKDKDGNFRSCNLYRKQFFNLFKNEMIKIGMPLSDEDKNWFYRDEIRVEKLIKFFMLSAEHRKDKLIF